MSNLHPSYGKYTKEEIQQMVDAPYGWKPAVEGEVKKKYLCRVSRDYTVVEEETAEIEIEAFSEDEARDILDKMDWDDFDWDSSSYNNDEEYDNFNIDSVKEL